MDVNLSSHYLSLGRSRADILPRGLVENLLGRSCFFLVNRPSLSNESFHGLSLPPIFFCEDPSWFPGKSKAPWQEITSAGLGKPETLKDGGLGQGNVWIVQDLLEAIEKDRQPLGSMYDGRAALEMILAVYEAHRIKGPVELPLKNRGKHPLTML